MKKSIQKFVDISFTKSTTIQNFFKDNNKRQKIQKKTYFFPQISKAVIYPIGQDHMLLAESYGFTGSSLVKSIKMFKGENFDDRFLSSYDNEHPSEILFTKKGQSKAIRFHKNGNLHRDNGKPATILFDEDGNVVELSWYQRGVLKRVGNGPDCVIRGRDGQVGFYKEGNPMNPNEISAHHKALMLKTF